MIQKQPPRKIVGFPGNGVAPACRAGARLGKSGRELGGYNRLWKYPPKSLGPSLIQQGLLAFAACINFNLGQLPTLHAFQEVAVGVFLQGQVSLAFCAGFEIKHR